MVSETSVIDAALMARLQGDAALVALLPDGIWLDEAPAGSKQYGLVQRDDDSVGDVQVFGGRGFEDYVFRVAAVVLSTTEGDVRAAAARIDALLQDQPLAVDGYVWMTTYRVDYVRVTEKDDLDASIRWLHRGGRYRLQMALA